MGKLLDSVAKLKGVDPRLLDIVRNAVAALPYDARITPHGGTRPAGDLGNHSKGYAIDIQLYDGDKALPNKGPAAFGAYEQYAQAARVYQTQTYPELDKTFRWGGGFRGGGTPLDLMHLDITPGAKGAMAYYNWNTGLTDAAKLAYPSAVSNGGLSDTTRVASIQQSLATGTPLNAINDAFPQPMPSDIASAYAPDARMMDMLTQPNPASSPPPIPRARPDLQAPPTLPTAPSSGVANITVHGGVPPMPRERPYPPTAPDLVRLASGKMIATGMYPAADGKHNFSVANDGQGNAVLSKQRNFGEIPGVVDPFREMNAPTIAGGYIRSLAAPKIDEIKTAVGNTVNDIGAGAQKTIADVGSQLGGIGNSLGGMLGGLFGGRPPLVPPIAQTNMAPMSPPPGPAAPTAQPGMLGRGQPPPVPAAPVWSMAPPANIAAYGAQQPPQLPPMINPQDAYAAGIQVPALPPSLSAINAAAPPNVAPIPMPGRPPDVPTPPNMIQQLLLNTTAGKALNALNGGKLGAYSGANDPNFGKVMQTSHGPQIAGQRLNGSPRGYTITGDDWFNAVRGL